MRREKEKNGAVRPIRPNAWTSWPKEKNSQPLTRSMGRVEKGRRLPKVDLLPAERRKISHHNNLGRLWSARKGEGDASARST